MLFTPYETGFLKIPELLLNLGILSSKGKDSSQYEKEKSY